MTTTTPEGMAPEGLTSFDAHELDAAMATIELYGRYSDAANDGSPARFSPFLVATIADLAAPLRDRSNYSHAHACRLYSRDALELLTHPDYRIQRVTIDTRPRDVIDHTDPLQVLAPQIVFVVLPEGSPSARRFHAAAAAWYYFPDSYNRNSRNRTATEPDYVPGWYNAPGIAGIVATFPTIEQAEDNAQELARAVSTVRRLGEAAAYRDDTARHPGDDDAHRLPRFAGRGLI